MDEFTADAFVNRDEPIPALAVPVPVPVQGNDPPSSEPKGKRDRLKEALSNKTSKAKENLQETTASNKEYGYSLQDRLFTKLLQQIIPEEELEELDLPQDVRSSKYINRPSFSIPLMTSNFRRFNARIGVVFVFQNRLERLLTWRTPSQTISLLMVLTFVCLDPYLFSVLPIAGALFFIMVPAYLARHPPPPTSNTHSEFSLTGPPLAPPRTIKPAGEMSKDFFRNVRDLQNCMADFADAHDLLNKYLTPPLNFSNESLSSTIFLFLFLAACALFLSAHLLPWRLITLVGCWTVIALGHPIVLQTLLANHDEHLFPHEEKAKSWLDSWVANDIILDASSETREVEVFELQRRKGGRTGEWENWMFSPSPFDPLSPQRISGDRPKGTRFFEDVMPPKGWDWDDKKWVLDLGSREWVEERMVQRVEVEVEGERWVGDLASDEIEDGEKGAKIKAGPGWEEGSGIAKIGEWRRRRWVRMVRRTVVGSTAS